MLEDSPPPPPVTFRSKSPVPDIEEGLDSDEGSPTPSPSLPSGSRSRGQPFSANLSPPLSVTFLPSSFVPDIEEGLDSDEGLPASSSSPPFARFRGHVNGELPPPRRASTAISPSLSRRRSAKPSHSPHSVTPEHVAPSSNRPKNEPVGSTAAPGNDVLGLGLDVDSVE